MKKIGIIGAGIFGCTTALELSKNPEFEVTIIERDNNILTGASTINHLRHHYGFHYPRSKETVQEIKNARDSFEEAFGECISDFFDDYYGVSLTNSKTTPKDFIKFCDEMKLPYEIAWPDEKYIDRSKIGICVKTPERVYDPDILRGIILKKISKSKVCLKLNHEIISGKVGEKRKIVNTLCGGVEDKEEFDVIINATYSNFNDFHKLFGLPRKKLQYELVELIEIYVPNVKNIGLTIMDGEFSSVLPRGQKGTFTLGHVDASVLKRVISDDIDSFLMTKENHKSNKKEILKQGIEDFPFLKDAKIVNSLFITRVVKPDVDSTDERPSEITEYGNGMYSIFGGKVITCVSIAREIKNLIEKDN